MFHALQLGDEFVLRPLHRLIENSIFIANETIQRSSGGQPIGSFSLNNVLNNTSMIGR